MRLKRIFIVKVLGPNKYPAFHSCTLTHGSQSIPGCNTKLNQQSAQQKLSDYITLMQRPVRIHTCRLICSSSNFKHSTDCLSVSFTPVQFFGSAAGGSAVVLHVLGRLGLEIVSLFDGMEGVVDGGAVGPAPGP